MAITLTELAEEEEEDRGGEGGGRPEGNGTCLRRGWSAERADCRRAELPRKEEEEDSLIRRAEEAEEEEAWEEEALLQEARLAMAVRDLMAEAEKEGE